MFFGTCKSYMTALFFILFSKLFWIQILIAADEDIDKTQELYLDLFNNFDKPPSVDSDSGTPSISQHRLIDDEEFSSSCSRASIYYSFNPACQKNVFMVERLLLSEENTTRLLHLAKELRDDPLIHSKVWFTALSIVSLERDELRGLWKPSPVQVMPDDFINKKVLEGALKNDDAETQEEGAFNRIVNNEKNCIVVDERLADGDPNEAKLWYFREDLQVNSHHWFWHITYPPIPPSMSTTFYNPSHADRRGELFFYMHHSVLARYNAERLANSLPLTTSMEVSPDYIMNGSYMPNLDNTNSGKPVAGRAGPTKLPETVAIRGEGGRVGYVLLNRTAEVKNRLLQGIDNGYLETNRGRVSIRTVDGIDRLTDTLEASVFSSNLGYYGSMHSSGHLLITFAHDPTNPDAVPSVIGDSSTSMRDFVFYNWHEMIDVMCDRHKQTLLPYRPSRSELPLSWSNVLIDDIKVYNSKPESSGVINTLRTFWSFKEITLASGLGFDRTPNLPPVRICLKHLNHDDFTYEIKLRSNGPQMATIRIFLAPRYDLSGQRFSMEAQRRLFFVLDTFNVALNSGGSLIKRDSTKSTLTIPWGDGLYNVDQQDQRPNCGCGWPHHLLLPKGNSSGITYDLFIMATNAVEDGSNYIVDDSNSPSYCHSAPLFCGVPKRKYPDSKPMGYPFDRTPYSVIEQQQVNGGIRNVERLVANLDEYVRFVPNARTVQIIIQHDPNNLETQFNEE